MEIKLRDNFELIAIAKKTDVMGTFYNAIVKYVGNNKTEFVVAVNYDIRTGSWGQGHYFSLFYDDADDINNVKQAEAEARKLFIEKYI